jgi:hypothetical protein
MLAVAKSNRGRSVRFHFEDEVLSGRATAKEVGYGGPRGLLVNASVRQSSKQLDGGTGVCGIAVDGGSGRDITQRRVRQRNNRRLLYARTITGSGFGRIYSVAP